MMSHPEKSSWAKDLAQDLPKTCHLLPKILSKVPRLWLPNLAQDLLPKILDKIMGKILVSWARSWPSCPRILRKNFLLEQVHPGYITLHPCFAEQGSMNAGACVAEAHKFAAYNSKCQVLS